MILRSDSKYPISRTYVVKLNSDATANALCGRLENLLSGVFSDFTSSQELLQLLNADLESGNSVSADAS